MTSSYGADRPHRRRWAMLAAVLLASLLTGCAELDPALIESVLGSATGPAPLNEATVARGLKEALTIGTGRAVERTSRIDGFLADELIRIYLPEEYEDAARTLRKIGFARQVDELEVAMNRAAERAAGEARQIFVDAITSMTLSDAFAILRGHDTAATDYLHDRTAETLRQRFQPIVDDKMEDVGLYRLYDRLAEVYNALPGSRRPAIDLDAYLTDRALDGLFTNLGQEERRIREDPVARTTELLRIVFARR